tara:strand:+ start:172 stop:888 length:717 start_codon:yes stop_codon:yes gene_type:complete
MKETDLYPPVKAFLESLGYEVQAEVKHCDVVAKQPDKEELIIIELKTSANLSLLIQATERQAISEFVYVAIPEKKYRRSQWRGIQRVIKQLGLGLMVVSTSKLDSVVNELFPPVAMRKTQPRKRRAVNKEMEARFSSYNTGGITGTELMTAYRQNAVLIACFLNTLGSSSAAHLKNLGAPENTRDIMASNHYGWFERVSRGIYQLTDTGRESPRAYAHLWDRASEIVTSAINQETAMD